MRISDWSSDVCSSDLFDDLGLCVRRGDVDLLFFEQRDFDAERVTDVAVLVCEEVVDITDVRAQADLAGLGDRTGDQADAAIDEAAEAVVIRTIRVDVVVRTTTTDADERRPVRTIAEGVETIGQASGREKVCENVKISGVA